MKGQISYDMRQEDQSPHPDERVCFLIDKEVKRIKSSKDEDLEYITAMCEYCGYHDIDGDGKIKLGQSNSLNAFYKHIHNFKEPPKTTLWLRDIIDDAVFELAKNRVEAEIK